jgi:hypothetical protein
MGLLSDYVRDNGEAEAVKNAVVLGGAPSGEFSCIVGRTTVLETQPQTGRRARPSAHRSDRGRPFFRDILLRTPVFETSCNGRCLCIPLSETFYAL